LLWQRRGRPTWSWCRLHSGHPSVYGCWYDFGRCRRLQSSAIDSQRMVHEQGRQSGSKLILRLHLVFTYMIMVADKILVMEALCRMDQAAARPLHLRLQPWPCFCSAMHGNEKSRIAPR
jgi:hypothetical protein